jgi:putative NADH-flavin reductase
VAQALEQGHHVTALARRPDRVGLSHPHLTVVAADLAAEDQDIGGCVPRHEAVLSALGVGRSLRSHNFMAHGTARIVSAMEQAGVARLVFLSAFGVGGTAPQAPWSFQLMFRLMLSDIYADKAAAEAIVRRSSLNWTIVAPVILTDRPASGQYRAGEQLDVANFAQIARADVADYMLRSITDPASFRRRIVLAP